MTGEQITNLDGMSPAEIAAATREGRMAALLSGDCDAIANAKADALIAEREAAEAKPTSADMGARGGPRSGGQVTAAELATMSPESIMKAQREGRLRDILA
jgi:hypothetical protein